MGPVGCGTGGRAPYAAAKWGGVGFSEALAKEGHSPRPAHRRDGQLLAASDALVAGDWG